MYQLFSIIHVWKETITVGVLTHLFVNGAGAHGIGKISGVLIYWEIDIFLMYDVSIARLILIIKLTLVYYENRERKKQV